MRGDLVSARRTTQSSGEDSLRLQQTDARATGMHALQVQGCKGDKDEGIATGMNDIAYARVIGMHALQIQRQQGCMHSLNSWRAKCEQAWQKSKANLRTRA
eukprot:32224-Pelagomonas_calceolata.AAC.6